MNKPNLIERFASAKHFGVEFNADNVHLEQLAMKAVFVATSITEILFLTRNTVLRFSAYNATISRSGG